MVFSPFLLMVLSVFILYSRNTRRWRAFGLVICLDSKFLLSTEKYDIYLKFSLVLKANRQIDIDSLIPSLHSLNFNIKINYFSPSICPPWNNLYSRRLWIKCRVSCQFVNRWWICSCWRPCSGCSALFSPFFI